MLLTRSLPPQFLLPSWTGAELALAVQRSFLSSTSTRRFKIGDPTSKGPALRIYEHLDLTAEPPVENGRPVHARPSGSEPPPSASHFKPRSIPVPLEGFYVGKKYGSWGSAEGRLGAVTDTLEHHSLNRRGIEDVRSRMEREDAQKPGGTKGTRWRVDPEGRGSARNKPADSSFTSVHANKIERIRQRLDALASKVGVSRNQKAGRRTKMKRLSEILERARRHETGEGLTREQMNHQRKLRAQTIGKRLLPDGLRSIEESTKDGRSGRNSIPPKVDRELKQDVAHKTAVVTIQTRRDDAGSSSPNVGEHMARDSRKTQISPSLKPPLWESKPLPESPEVVGSLKLSAEQISSAAKPVEHSTHNDPQSAPEELSLFEELFPEESKQSDAVRRAEERLDKLPAFEWDLDERFDARWKAERERKKERRHTIPPMRESPSSAFEETRWVPVASVQESPVFKKNPELNNMREPSVVVISGVSKHLEESDFFRIGPKGNHIEGWTSGILRVVAARDHVTLEPLGYYYLYFSSDAAARAYMDNTLRLHALGKSKGPSSTPFMPPPPGSLRGGENIQEVLRAFTVVPRQGKLAITMLRKPHTPQVLKLFENGGPPIMAPRASKDDALVLFSVDTAYVTYYDILYAIKDDGRRRNMHWRFADGKKHDITDISFNTATQEEGQGGSTHKYIFAMKDMQEARRFVREWHRRPLEVASKRRYDKALIQEKPAVVHAELLW